ncbi:uncharacterized protein LOC108740533 [Agrilus planipennis]|uniref:Uncharacterized protein LOC108740533 n=1 Tax=Agrilus planipennis TaxID=224129 RepID=A0A1W4XC48_AGRPL|nr:uncharacterized protein LOC108740533 [Agrilus planipennis]
MSSEENHDLTKTSLEALKEMLNRYEALLKNRTVIENLLDKGESIKKAHKRVYKELKSRESIQHLESSLSTMSVNCKENSCGILNEKHVQHICELEKPFEDKRYRPHRTLMHKSLTSEEPTSSLTKKSEEPTQCIPLVESLIIQSEQFQKAKEDQAKQFLLGFTKEDEVEEPDIDIESVAINSDDLNGELEIVTENG